MVTSAKPALPVWLTLRAALRISAEHWRTLLRALLVPALLIASFHLLSLLANSQLMAIAIAGIGSQRLEFELVFAGLMLLGLFSSLIGVILAVSCHRIILLGSKALPNRWGLYWSRREFRFLGWALLFGLASGLGVLFIWIPGMMMIPEYGLTGATAVSAYTIVRAVTLGVTALATACFGMVLPATAIDGRSSLRQAWNLARGNIIRLAILLWIPLFTVSMLSHWVIRIGGYSGTIFSSLHWFIFALVGAFEIIVLSIAYRELVSQPA